MKTFTDSKGRTWTIEANVSSLRRVKAATDVDLTKLVDPKDDTIGRLTGDLFLLFDVLCAMLQPQLDEKAVSREQFGESLDEESAEKAVMALIEGVIDFFRDGKRTLLKRAFTKVTQAADRVQAKSLDEAMRTIEAPEFDRAIQTALEGASMSGGSSTRSPASSASTLRPVIGRSEGAKPVIYATQRHYQSQKSAPSVDARLDADLRTAIPGNRGGVRYQPQWIEAIYNVLVNKRSNLQLGVLVEFSYACKLVRSPKAIELFADAWKAMSPLLEFVVD